MQICRNVKYNILLQLKCKSNKEFQEDNTLLHAQYSYMNMYNPFSTLNEAINIEVMTVNNQYTKATPWQSLFIFNKGAATSPSIHYSTQNSKQELFSPIVTPNNGLSFA